MPSQRSVRRRTGKRSRRRSRRISRRRSRTRSRRVSRRVSRTQRRSYRKNTRRYKKRALRKKQLQTGGSDPLLHTPPQALPKTSGEGATAHLDVSPVVAASDKNGNVIVWDVNTENIDTGIIRNILVHDNHVRSVQFSPDGDRILTTSFGDTGQIIVKAWDVDTGDCINTRTIGENRFLTAEYGKTHNQIGIVTNGQSSDKRKTLTIYDKDMETAQSTSEVLGNSSHLITDGSVDCHPDVVELQNMIFRDFRFIHVEGRDQAGTLIDRGVVNNGTYVKYNKNGDMIVAPEKIRETGRHVLQVFNKQGNGSWSEHKVGDFVEEVKYAEFSPVSNDIIAACGMFVQIWEFQDQDSEWTRVNNLGHPRTVTSAKFSPDGDKIITACDDHSVNVWRQTPDIGGWESEARLRIPESKDLGLLEEIFNYFTKEKGFTDIDYSIRPGLIASQQGLAMALGAESETSALSYADGTVIEFIANKMKEAYSKSPRSRK